MKQCLPTGADTKLSLNILLHVSVLFTFLTIFYSLYGSKVESQASNNQFKQIIGGNVEKILKEGNEKSGGLLKKGVEVLDPFLDVLEKQYSKPDEANEIYNNWLFRSSGLVSVFLFLIIFIIVLILSLSCQQCPSQYLGKLIFENAVIFTGVGFVEYLFFKNIALKYIPAPPSLMVDRLIEDIDKLFS